MLKNLRSLYRRSSKGVRNRREIKLSFTPELIKLMEMHVDLGKGKYASPFVELSVRVMIALMTDGEDVEQVTTDIKKVMDSPYFSRNLRRMANLIEE